ncbi:MAG: hypothetical protein KAS71_03645, partial [Bacteroidales bacterium]|nr:hypothetical protein [Bacteroidales bacterium]
LAAGHGIIRFNKKERTIVMEAWPRGVDVTKEDAKQFPGWPVKIIQEENYSRKAKAWLPEIKVEGMEDPVFQVIEESSDEVVYTIRILGSSFRPKVFQDGLYTIKIGDQDTREVVLEGIKAGNKSLKAMKVEL